MHEIFDGKFQALEVPDVDDPDPIRAVLLGKRKLFPHFRNRVGVDPFVIARSADVVEMIVDSRAPGACILGSDQDKTLKPFMISEFSTRIQSLGAFFGPIFRI